MSGKIIPVKFNRRDALSLWHDVNLKTVLGTSPDLAPRQMVVLTTIYLEQGPHTVRSLALKLNVTKAVITRAIDTLESLKYVRRCADPRDKRSVLIDRTARGSNYLSCFADDIRENLKKAGGSA